LWEGGIRVPGLLEWPAGIAQPRVASTPCSSLDFFPTVLDLLAIPHVSPRPLDGVSLRGIIEGKETERARPIGFEFERMAAWLENRYKLVAFLRDAVEQPAGGPREAPAGKLARPGEGFVARVVDRVALYDIVADPGEEEDLASQRPARVESMLAAL